jgi:hypothetical protein
MSINDFTNKIKKNLNIDTFTIVCLFVIVGVGIGAFGLGRLSATTQTIDSNDEIQIIDTRALQASSFNLNQNIPINTKTDTIEKEKRYVASKNGKLYYSLGCSGAKRIAEKNMVWFGTTEEAEKSGYEFSSSCK